MGLKAGPVDNRGPESRSDVFLYTSEPLQRDLDVVGPVSADDLDGHRAEPGSRLASKCSLSETEVAGAEHNHLA